MSAITPRLHPTSGGPQRVWIVPAKPTWNNVISPWTYGPLNLRHHPKPRHRSHRVGAEELTETVLLVS